MNHFLKKRSLSVELKTASSILGKRRRSSVLYEDRTETTSRFVVL